MRKEEDERARKEQHDEQDVKSCVEFTRKRLREMEEVRSKRLLEIGMDEEAYERRTRTL